MANGQATSSRGTGSGSRSGSPSGVLSQRLGPLPLWVWAIVAVGVYLVFLRKKSTTSSTASTGSVSVPPQTETVTYPTGSSYSGPVGYAPGGTGGGGGGASPGTGPGSGPGGGNVALTGGQILGGGGPLSFHGTGYSVGNYQGGTVQGSTGSPYTTISSYNQTLNYLNSGVPVFYQPAPGVFQQLTASRFKQLEATGKAGPGKATTTYVKA